MQQNSARANVLSDDKLEPDVTQLVTALSFFHPISPAIEQFFKQHVKPLSFRKKKLLLKANTICDHLYFIKRGAIRGYIKDGNKEITTWITAENELVTSIGRLSKRQASKEYIQTVENCELLAMPIADLEQLYIEMPEFNIVGRKLLANYYEQAEQRAFITRVAKADQKYRYFLDSHHHLANRIPQTYIASYLGITPETLSKVRRKLSIEK